MAQCLTPYQLEKDGHTVVPCGKCPECRARRASGWSFRLMQEYKAASSACFLTLTYDDKSQPYTETGQPTLFKPHMQNFFKSLRKQHTEKIRYYYVGEYGGITNRPHYHVIMFNADQTKMQPCWPHGQLHYGQVSEASVGYCLKYITKPRTIPEYIGDLRHPQYANMSKGLGSSYLTPQMVAWHKEDLTERMFCNIADGKKISMPRYLKNKIYNDEERETIASAFALSHLLDVGDAPITRQELAEREANILAAFQKQSKKDKINSKI